MITWLTTQGLISFFPFSWSGKKSLGIRLLYKEMAIYSPKHKDIGHIGLGTKKNGKYTIYGGRRGGVTYVRTPCFV